MFKNMKNILKKLKIALYSRTTWTIIVLFIINGIYGVRDLIPASAIPVIDGILGILAIYFRVNPNAEKRV